MNWCAIVLTGGLVLGQAPTPPTTTPPAALPTTPLSEPAPQTEWSLTKTWCGSTSGFLRGDQDFGRFIHPVTNPVFAKDPRASTQLRGLFIHDTIPGDHPVGGGNFQAAALQANIAVNERLTIIADKDGYLWFNPGAAPSSSGFLNLGVGLKYSFIRDVENQFIVSGGFMYEIPSGEADAFSGHGNGAFAFFVTTGKEFAERFHFLNTTGYYVPVNSNQNSSFFYTSFHLDYQVNCWLYPLVEMNWFHYTAGGDRGLPPALGEGDGLVNLGTSGVGGNDLLTFAVGARARLTERVSLGGAWEFPISNRHDLIQNRFVFDLIYRY